ncbi:uncharacterized protein (TIGR00251 family) [Saccharothrix ecbatanensis]|uniref:UPF0235 protein F4560_004906 n=1 Tax=Saccharothrix ecbatanensis TaxID=1105145 RepID=A0A7W9M2P6_9PSEU|nr:DUF167 domain-containing protein [Saccharothrix ecbatanensis]MBB5805138.1 uncharacterized protein (TIGR00251 family) [Saccharothrix ecbatanensis]
MFRFTIRVKPGAKREAVGGRWGDDALVVAVAAPAVEGKANEAVRKALARAFGVRKQDVDVIAGERGRDKVIQVDPAPAGAADVLARLLDG